MSIVNQIPQLNLNPVLISLQNTLYGFLKNKNDVISGFNSQIESLDSQIESVNNSIKETKQGFEVETSELRRLNVNTDGCTVKDKNKRQENILKALDERKSELTERKSSIESTKSENESFYDNVINAVKDIINGLVELLKRLIQSIGIAITALESAMIALAAIPLGAGVAPSTSLGFIGDLLQTKIYEPVKDTVDQQEEYGETIEPESSVLDFNGNRKAGTNNETVESTPNLSISSS